MLLISLSFFSSAVGSSGPEEFFLYFAKYTTHTHTHTHSLSLSLSRTHTHTHARTHARTHNHRHTHTPSLFLTHTQTHTHAYTHTNTHTHSHTHTHTSACLFEERYHFIHAKCINVLKINGFCVITSCWSSEVA